MKIGRRSFLSFIAGGTVGTALSPLPWKLIDDVSIWSQVWPWVPIPKGGESVCVKTTCSLCSGGCGINVHKVNNRAVKIEGVKNHPINDGSICGLGVSGLQFLYGPTRVKSPLKCVGERGSGRWKEISWDEAISIVVDKLKLMNTTGDSDKVACISGFKNINSSIPMLLERFFEAYGSRNFISVPLEKNINELSLNKLCDIDANIYFDFKNSDFILSFGTGFTDGWNSPVKMIKAASLWKDSKEVSVVQIEPFFSNSGAKSDQWICINPGTEADLAFGISAYIIKNRLFDTESVKKVVNFDNFEKKLILSYSLESVSRVTNVSVETIIELSENFINSSKGIAVFGRGKGDNLGNFRDYSSIHLLNILKGNINKAGGVWLFDKHDYINWPSLPLDNNISNIGDNNNKYSLKDFFNKISTKQLFIKAMFFAEFNPCYQLPDTSFFKKVIDSIPFLVNFSSFMDETAFVSDLILPNNIYLERYEDIPIFSDLGKQVVAISAPVVHNEFNTKHLGDIIINMANKFGSPVSNFFPWSSYKQCIQEILQNEFIISNKNNFFFEKEVKPISLNEINLDKINFSPLLPEGNINSFPFILIPYDSIKLSSNYIFTPPYLMKILSDKILKGNSGFVNINSETAKVVGVKEGDYAVLSTPKGEVKIRVHIDDVIKPGLITIVRGLGHTAYDGYIANKGVNVNDIIEFYKDSVIGHDAFWGIRAKLVKAK